MKFFFSPHGPFRSGYYVGQFIYFEKTKRWFWLLRQMALFCQNLEHCVAIKRQFTSGLSTSPKCTKIRTPEICFNGMKFLPTFFTQVLWCERSKWGVRGVEKQTVAEIANMWNQGNWGRSESRSTTILTILKSAHSSNSFQSYYKFKH